ncbi:hypothetical protein PIB30_067256 [Stylosanthes scabra]|uniref:Peptidase A1 domain-containing protein n=1 Tax=Stylosanthes scabra TaxID=79078 RepID=A0ABU6SMP6_9FABA|nr:hypothetical protein [Stylosanthes scabra]
MALGYPLLNSPNKKPPSQQHTNPTMKLPLPISLTTISLTILLLLLSTSTQVQSKNQDGLTLQVFHMKPQKQLSWQENVLQMQAKDEGRVEYLSSLVAGRSVVPIASGRQIIQSPTYIVRGKIGTPPQTLLLAMDTSNDAAWIPCTSCDGCSSTLFSPQRSTTFRNLPCGSPQCNQVPNPSCSVSACSFNLTYGSSSIAANLAQDTITLATDPIPSYTFGCVTKTTGPSSPPQGLLGLGRGPLSLLSQTQNLYQSTFSYCLPSFKSLNFSGSLRLGPVAQPIRIKFTPLLKNPRRSSLYYVNLVAIRVGRRIVDIPPAALAFNPTTGAGTIFDSGTVFTRLVMPAYNAVRDEFRRRVGPNLNVTSLGGFDTCYNVPIVAPTITFMFSGMNVTLPQDNILIHSTAGSTTCLAMAAAPDNVNSVLNVIANMQQQNHRVLFDIPNSRLGVARELCTK